MSANPQENANIDPTEGDNHKSKIIVEIAAKAKLLLGSSNLLSFDNYQVDFRCHCDRFYPLKRNNACNFEFDVKTILCS